MRDFNELRNLAERGDPEALYTLGVSYTLGACVDEAKGQEFLEKAAEKGHSGAQFVLGQKLMQDATPIFETIAAAPINLSQFTGPPGQKIPKEVIAKFQAMENAKALERKSAAAPYLANARKNVEKALKLLEQSANQGYYEAQYALGLIYARGLEHLRNPKLGFTYLERAANQGHDGAICRLGELCVQGVGTPKNISKACEYFQRAIEMGNPHALSSLGAILLFGMGEVPAKKEEGLQMIQEAAEKGSKEAQFNLAQLYWKGDQVKKDKTKAIEWAKKSADQKFPFAQKLYEDLLSGKNIAQNKGLSFPNKTILH
jgi:TPR repeat protein